MLSIATALGLVLLSKPLPQQGSLTRQVLPAITGRNGYEEFVQAADIVSGPAFDLYTQPKPQTGPAGSQSSSAPTDLIGLSERLGKMNVLEVRREALQKYGGALELVRKGNRKEVFDPRTQISPETIYPELSGFRRIARLFVFESYVRFSEGNSAAGTKSLLDGLEFSYNTAGGNILASLVGVATSSMILAAVEQRLPMFSVADCRRTREIAHAALQAPRQMTRAWEAERRTASAALDEIFAKPDYLMRLIGGEDPLEIERAGRTIVALKEGSPALRQTWRQQAEELVSRYYTGVTELIKRPEQEWFGPAAGPKTIGKGANPVVLDLVQSVLPNPKQILATEARMRTQFRVLALHAAVLEFRWKHDRLPEKLLDAVLASEAHDPLANAPFVFQRQGNGYRLASKGFGTTGEIQLMYRSPVGRSNRAGSGPP